MVGIVNSRNLNKSANTIDLLNEKCEAWIPTANGNNDEYLHQWMVSMKGALPTKQTSRTTLLVDESDIALKML